MAEGFGLGVAQRRGLRGGRSGAAEGAVIASDGDALSVLLASAETASAARAMVSAGLGRAAVLARLHGG